MTHPRHIAWPLYLTGLAIVAVPALEFVVTVSPLSPTLLSWRVAAVGILSRAVLTPLVGLVILLGAAVLLEHARVQRALMVVGFFGCGALLLTAVMFALDLVQLRGQVRVVARPAYDTSSAMALVKLLVAAGVLLSFGLSGLLTARRAARAAHHAAPTPVIARAEHAEEAPPAS